MNVLSMKSRRNIRLVNTFLRFWQIQLEDCPQILDLSDSNGFFDCNAIVRCPDQERNRNAT